MKKVDKDYWATVTQHPLSPSLADVAVYRRHLKSGNTLLLGCTRGLVELSTHQMDIDPWLVTPTTIISDWTANTGRYTNIIGDGVLNFTRELCDDLLEMCASHAEVFVARSFNRKQDGMKVAAHFPQRDDFKIAPTTIEPFAEYSFFVWQFK